jgi:hypothetical protein
MPVPAPALRSLIRRMRDDPQAFDEAMFFHRLHEERAPTCPEVARNAGLSGALTLAKDMAREVSERMRVLSEAVSAARRMGADEAAVRAALACAHNTRITLEAPTE